MAKYISKEEACAVVRAFGLRPLVQRGFYSHFIRAIDDSHQTDGATSDFRKGRIKRRALIKAIANRKTRQAAI